MDNNFQDLCAAIVSILALTGVVIGSLVVWKELILPYLPC